MALLWCLLFLGRSTDIKMLEFGQSSASCFLVLLLTSRYSNFLFLTLSCLSRYWRHSWRKNHLDLLWHFFAVIISYEQFYLQELWYLVKVPQLIWFSWRWERDEYLLQLADKFCEIRAYMGKYKILDWTMFWGILSICDLNRFQCICFWPFWVHFLVVRH